MAYIKFPFRVKLKGVYYAPNTLIEVDDPTEYVKAGASEEIKRTGRRATKPSASHKGNTRKEQ